MRTLKTKSLGNLPIQLEPASKEFLSIRQSMLDTIDQIAPEWTDRYAGDLGIVLVELMAYMGDILSYSIDKAQNESYLATAQERKNIIKLLELIGYNLKSGTSAQAPMAFITTQDNVIIPKGAKFLSNTGSLEFETLEQITLPTAGVYCQQGYAETLALTLGVQVDTLDNAIVTSGISKIVNVGKSNGKPNQTFTLSDNGIVIGSNSDLSLQINGATWTAQESFLDTESDSLVYTYRLNDDDTITLTFGNDLNGAIPTANADLILSYRSGIGQKYNAIGIGGISQIKTNVVGLATAFNVAQPSGGSDSESNESAKKNGPLSLKSLDRAITLQDFETLAIKTPNAGIKSARAIAGEGAYDVEVYLACEGLNPKPSGKWYRDFNTGTGIIGMVGRYLFDRKPIPTRLLIAPCETVEIKLNVNVLAQSNYLNVEVKNTLLTNIKTMLSSLTDDFGKPLALSKVIQLIENSRGVDTCDIIRLHRKPKLLFKNGSNQNALDLAVFDFDYTSISETTVEDTYYIEWQSNLSFFIKSEKNGYIKNGNTKLFIMDTQTKTFTIYTLPLVDTEDTPERYKQYTFTLTLGNSLPVLDDIWVFKVNKIVSNINVSSNEIIVPRLLGANLLLDQNDIKINVSGGKA